MEWTIKSILARCNGNRYDAVVYCREIAKQYAHLRHEYSVMAIAIELQMTDFNWKAEAAHAGN